MPSRLPFEPSVEALIAETLPDAIVTSPSPEALRKRVTWPILARVTGLGLIHGGEIVLAPAQRAADILSDAESLAKAGVAAIVVAGRASREAPAPPLPIIFAPPQTDFRGLLSDLESFIIRRRRELFELGQEFHRAFVEVALVGGELDQLLRMAVERTGTTVAFCEDGVIRAEPSGADLADLELSIDLPPGGITYLGEEDASAAIPVTAGDEQIGVLSLLHPNRSTLDEAEMLLETLASACAIVLTRQIASGPRPVQDFLDGRARLPAPRNGFWHTLALRATTVAPHRLARALEVELEVRGIAARLAVENDTLVAFVDAKDGAPWQAIVDGVTIRARAASLRAGLSRPKTGSLEVRRAVNEALDVLRLATDAGLTCYRQVEVELLLESANGAQEFMEARLGGLLSGTRGARELLLTLEQYLAAGRNVSAAARALAVHRNTLHYRLHRLRSMLGADLDDHDTAFALDLAIRWYRLRERIRSGESSD